MESPPLAGTTTLGRQRWLRLIPIVFVTYSLAYLDRSNFSIAAAGGMAEDLGITSSTSGLIGASFFAGYFLLQVPGVLYADRRSVRDLIFWSVLAWGALATLQGLLSSVTLLIVVRFLLGAVEAAVLPALVVLLARWFTKAERGRANAFLILGNPVTVMWLSAASGYLIEATSWRGMFIIEGVPALIWAFFFRAQVRDRPADAPWLDAAERAAVDTAIAGEQAELAETGTRHPLAEALRSPTVLVLAVQYLLWSVGVYGFVFWLPSIVKAGSSAGIGATGLLSAVPYAFAVVAMLLNSRSSDRTTRRIRYVWPSLFGGAVTFYGSYLAGHDAFWLSFPLLVLAGIAMYAPYGPFFAMIPELLPRRTAGVAVALVNAAGALGGFLGTYLVGWLRTATGTDAAAFLMLAGTMAASALVLFAVRPPKRKVA
ncbi:MFS transporter [Amycolatopsis thermophila]|uniref:Sugar phosphate permease n=1 Tax=Amycolatopsis thermophila TaxID=206084 RepID=A0ABU0EXG0_9PSEU|nr:MFS transporter [Amycolatopsis thermophila]MDQ0379794.1 sugar phosphate permease [Amycolatopsis thermophila]